MKAAFRVDASLEIGSGHVMRCLTLADALRAAGAQCLFISRAHPGHLLELIRQRGFAVTALPAELLQPPANTQVVSERSKEPVHASFLGCDWQTDAEETIKAAAQWLPDGIDWLVVDHYQLDATWERLLRPHTRKLMVIDDLANRPHDCDLLLDQNYYRDLEKRYQGLVPSECVMLLGPDYVLLRPEFTVARQRLKVKDGSIRRILIFFGGSDPTDQTQKAMMALQLLGRPDIKVDVVVGSANPERSAIQKMCEQLPNTMFHCQVSNMAELISNADLGIGAGGSAMWERCCLGLPTITVVFAANQERTTEDVAEIGAIEYLGWVDQLAPENYARAVTRMLGNAQKVRLIGATALGVLRPEDTSLPKVMGRLSKDSEITVTSAIANTKGLHG
jgi:UDP-2,4-diacetamido-2,4,6-trideoxy-beta-L-altropyranose hydrolase